MVPPPLLAVAMMIRCSHARRLVVQAKQGIVASENVAAVSHQQINQERMGWRNGVTTLFAVVWWYGFFRARFSKVQLTARRRLERAL